MCFSCEIQALKKSVRYLAESAFSAAQTETSSYRWATPEALGNIHTPVYAPSCVPSLSMTVRRAFCHAQRRAAKSASGATAASGVEMRAKGPFKADEAKAGSESGGATVGGGDPDTKDSSMPMPALMGTSRHVPDEALVDRDETGAPSKDPFVLRLSSRRLQPPDPPSCNHFMCWCKLVSVLFGSYLLLLMGFRGWVGAFQVDLVFSPLAADECVDACGVADTDSTCCSYSPLLPEGITREELTITGGSSFAIDAWLMESAPDAPRPLVPVLYAHAADGNIASAGRVSRYKWLLEQGVVLLAFDYPGYGKSDFRPSEAVVYFSATMAHDYLQRELNRRATAAAAAAQGGGIAEANAAAEAAATAGYMMGFGRGLGGNVLVRLSAAREFDALVLQSVPNSVGGSCALRSLLRHVDVPLTPTRFCNS